MRTPNAKTLQSLIEKNGFGVGTLEGLDSNSFVLMTYTRRRLAESGWSPHDIDTVMEIAMSGTYVNLIWVLSFTLDETQ